MVDQLLKASFDLAQGKWLIDDYNGLDHYEYYHRPYMYHVAHVDI